jgi:uncharacterized protein
MKQWTIVSGLTLACLLAAVLFLRGQATTVRGPEVEKDKHTINASGAATIRIKPDAARVFFGVQTIAKTVKAAREENSARTKAVLDALRNLHIKDLKMKTSNVNVELLQSHRGEATLPEILGFRLTNSFTVLITDQDAARLSVLASQVLDAALEAGANQVQQIVFFVQNEEEVNRQALSKAVEDALANARALAAGARVNIRDTVAISGQPEYSYPVQVMRNSMPIGGLGGSETPVVAGDLEITCRVNIECRY